MERFLTAKIEFCKPDPILGIGPAWDGHQALARVGGVLYLAIGLIVLMHCGCASVATKGSDLSNHVQDDSNLFTRRLSLARLSERHGQLDRAEAIYRQMIDDDPNRQVLHHRLGVISAKTGRIDQAIQQLNYATSLGPPNTELLNDLGFAYYLKHDLATAETMFQQVLADDPTNKRALNNLGLVLGELGDYESSLNMFRQCGTEAEALANLGYAQTRIGRLDDARKTYHHALELDPTLRPAADAILALSAPRRANGQVDELRPG